MLKQIYLFIFYFFTTALIASKGPVAGSEERAIAILSTLLDRTEKKGNQTLFEDPMGLPNLLLETLTELFICEQVALNKLPNQLLDESIETFYALIKLIQPTFREADLEHCLKDTICLVSQKKNSKIGRYPLPALCHRLAQHLAGGPVNQPKKRVSKVPPQITKLLQQFDNNPGYLIRQLAAQNKANLLNKVLQIFPGEIDNSGSSQKNALYYTLSKYAFDAFKQLVTNGANIWSYIPSEKQTIYQFLRSHPSYKTYLLFVKAYHKEQPYIRTFPLFVSYFLKDLPMVSNPSNILLLGCKFLSPRTSFKSLANMCPELFDFLHNYPNACLDLIDPTCQEQQIKEAFAYYPNYLKLCSQCIKSNPAILGKMLHPGNYKKTKPIKLKQIKYLGKCINLLYFNQSKYQIIFTSDMMGFLKNKGNRFIEKLFALLISRLRPTGVFCIDNDSLDYILFEKKNLPRGIKYVTERQKLARRLEKKHDISIFSDPIKSLNAFNLTYKCRASQRIYRLKSAGMRFIVKGNQQKI